MEQVGVDREGRLAALVLGDRDLVLLGELDELGAARQVPFAPGGDDGHVRLQRVVGELEADLVVALAGGAVGDGIGADGLGDLDLALGDERAGDGGAEEIEALIHRVGAEHREDVVLHEGLAQVVHEDVLGLDAEQQRLVARRAQFLALAEIGGEGDDLAAIGRLQPLQDDRGVETAGIGEDDFLDGLLGGHEHSLTGLGRGCADLKTVRPAGKRAHVNPAARQDGGAARRGGRGGRPRPPRGPRRGGGRTSDRPPRSSAG